MVDTVGGQTLITGEPVLVTPEGVPVGSAMIPRGGSSRRRNIIRAEQQRLIDEALKKRRAEFEKRQGERRQEEEKKRQEEQAQRLKEQTQAEQVRRQEVEKKRVVTSLKRLEQGKISRFTFQTTEGRVTVTGKQQAKRIRESLEGRRVVEREAQREEREEPVMRRPVSEVQPVREPKGILEKARADLERGTETLRTKRLRGEITPIEEVKSFGLGVGTSFIGTGLFIKSLVIAPIETTKAFGKGVVGAGKKVVTGEGFPRVGLIIEEDPAFALGFIGGEIAQFKSVGAVQKGVVKTTDFVRTKGLTELPKEKIIAKEFFQGQTFPQIRKGQTAGELLKEFKPILPGEVKPAGFTASPKPFKKITTAGRGTSELPGVFQAPRVSPRFLRLASEEKKVFTLNILGETLRPSITRITPTKVSLVPGTKPGQTVTQPQRLKEIKIFFEKAPKGESFVPFIKTEKEAIIPFGTGLERTGKRFFIKFEGRKVPVAEFKTVPGTRTTGTITAGDIARSVSRSRVGRRGLVSPSQLISPVSKVSRARRGITSRGIVSPSKSVSSGFGKISSVKVTPSPSVRTPPSSVRISGFASSVSRVPRTPTPRIITPPITGTPPTPTPKRISGSFGIRTPSRRIPGQFAVSVRRFGKFRTVGTRLSLQRAISVGRSITSRGLGATFRITPIQKGTTVGSIRTPKGFKQKKGLIFIEQPSLRLSTRSEVEEIQVARRIKT
jgi:hypothetical protein